MGEVRRIAVEDAPPLEELLAAVEAGDVVDLVRGEMVVARLDASFRDDMTGDEAVALARRLRGGRNFGEGDLKALIDEGRE